MEYIELRAARYSAAMASKRSLLELFTSAELNALAERLDRRMPARKEPLVAAAMTLPKILQGLTNERLRELCRASSLDAEGDTPTLLRRLTGGSAATHLYGLVARDARTAVVFRRGPSKHVRMILWDLATDRWIAGQWLSGRIYEERCGISPDGTLLVYFAGKFKSKLGTFTAVSRPPYFTALALWPDGGTYGGGGFFEENRKLILNYGYVLKEINDNSTIPVDFLVSDATEHRKRHNSNTDSEHGWALKSPGVEAAPTSKLRHVFAPPRVHTKAHPTCANTYLERSTLGMFEVNGPRHIFSYRVIQSKRDAEPPTELGRLDWADWDHDGSLLFAHRGCLFRQSLHAATRGAREEPAKLIADLRDQIFTNVVPSKEALVWP